jgi:hypothetical protein
MVCRKMNNQTLQGGKINILFTDVSNYRKVAW